MEPACREKYRFNTHNKGVITQLVNYLTEVVVDQVGELPIRDQS